jgi:hypothetical protein
MSFFLCSSFLFLIVWLCASSMSRLVLDIELLRRLDVIDIDLILIYYPLSKKYMSNNSNFPGGLGNYIVEQT